MLPKTGRKIMVVIAFLSFTYTTKATLSYQELNGRLDFCQMYLEISTDSIAVNFAANNKASDGQDGNDAENLNPTTKFNIWTIQDGRTRLSIDSRPYADNYYVEYPLGISLVTNGEYKFYPGKTKSYKAATVVYLYDTTVSSSVPVANLKAGECYSFSVSGVGASSLVITDRFFVRIYGAYLSTENYDGNWNDPKSWQGGVPPAEANHHAVINSTSVIHSNPSDEIEIGFLTNYGHLENNGSLKVIEGVDLFPEE